jgi:uncharacterized protein (TIGR02001 family)
MKKTTLALAMGLMISGAVNAALEANIGATSNYMWRGVTQTEDGAAVSGGIDYSNDSGAYAGVWASSVDFGAASTATAEMDLYAGYSTDSYDLGVIKYMYPSERSLDFTEVYGSVTMSGITAGVAYDPDNKNKYFSLSTEVELTEGFGLAATAGMYDMDAADSDYNHITLDISKSDFTFSLSKVFSDDSGNLNDDVIPYVSYSKTF